MAEDGIIIIIEIDGNAGITFASVSTAVEVQETIITSSIGLLDINLSLDKADKIYQAGQSLTGKVVLKLENPIEALGLRIKCKGEAQIYFTDSIGGLRRKYSGDETYLCEKLYIRGDGENKAEIASGEYLFGLRLPDKLPCSFEGRYGRIRYSIRAFLDVAKKSYVPSSTVPFTFCTIVDLNDNAQAQLPINEQNLNVFLGQTRPISLEVDIPVRGFVPGQLIPMKIKLNNESNVELRKLRILLKKVIIYHAFSKSRRHKEVIVEIEQPVTQKKESYNVDVDIPAVPPTGMNFCNLLDVRYTLKVETRVDVNEWYYRLFHKNVKVRMNVIIGTIPLKYYEKTLEELNHQSSLLSEDEKLTLRNEIEAQNGLLDGKYGESQIYRSSKPGNDDPTGKEDDCDFETSSYYPMYRMYQFGKTEKGKILSRKL